MYVSEPVSVCMHVKILIGNQFVNHLAIIEWDREAIDILKTQYFA